jgi:hypothetical protein
MPGQQGAPPTWTHSDSDGKAELARALDVKSFRTKPDGSPRTTQDRVRLVRALAFATEYTVEDSYGSIPLPDETGQLTLGSEVRGDRFRTRADCYAASTIARTWLLFSDPGRHVVYTAVTHEGEPAVLTPEPKPALKPEPPGDVAFPPLLVGVIVVVAIAACASAVCYVAQAAAEVIDRKLTEDALTTRLVQTQAQALGLVNDHTERQRAANRSIPWDPAELKVLDSLFATQQQIAERTRTPLPNPFVGAVEAAREAGKKLAETGTGLGVGAMVALGAYLVTR